MNVDRGMYRVAKDLRADDARRATQDRRAAAARDDVKPTAGLAAPTTRRPIFAGLRRLSGHDGLAARLIDTHP